MARARVAVSLKVTRTRDPEVLPLGVNYRLPFATCERCKKNICNLVDEGGKG